MKLLKVYLIISSILLHIGVVVALAYVVPFYRDAMNIGEQWTETAKTAPMGVVRAVSTLQRGELTYRGYQVELGQDTVFISGLGPDVFEQGERVQVLVNEHPYGPLKTLMATLMKAPESPAAQPAP